MKVGCCKLELVKTVVFAGSGWCCGGAVSGVSWRLEVLGMVVE